MSVLGLIPTARTFFQRILTLRLIFQRLPRRFWTAHTPVTTSRKFWVATCFGCSVTSSEPATNCRPLPSPQTEKQKLQISELLTEAKPPFFELIQFTRHLDHSAVRTLGRPSLLTNTVAQTPYRSAK